MLWMAGGVMDGQSVYFWDTVQSADGEQVVSGGKLYVHHSDILHKPAELLEV